MRTACRVDPGGCIDCHCQLRRRTSRSRSGSSGALLEDYKIESHKELVAFYNYWDNGFHTIRAFNATHLRIRWIRNADASIADEAWMTKT